MARRAGFLLALALAVTALTHVGRAQDRPFRPVTDETLRNPSPSDWLAWRGTSSSQGFSPLNQITRANVQQLQLAWSWTMERGSQHSAPLVYDGIMYLPNPGGGVQALDATNGELIWEYRPEGPANQGRPVRGISIYDDKIFLHTPDGQLVALDARNGHVAWSALIGASADGFAFGAGPIVAHGKVVSGMGGCQKFIERKCAITAHDPKTGKQLWSVATIPKPGDPGAESWGDVPYLYRSGVSTWIPGSYDPELNLVYYSTSQAKPFARAARGTDGDALYSNTTLAIDPDTGRVVWHRQVLPGDTHDQDEVFENILVDIGANKLLFRVGKIGILWRIDRRTGKILQATDLGLQNLVDVDPATGVVTHRPSMIPKLDTPIDQCPGTLGSRNWPSMAYSPETTAFYLPQLLACARQTYHDVKKVPGGGGNGWGAHEEYIRPDANGQLGALAAIDVSGKVLWQQRQRAVFTTAALATAGGLVFIGDVNRNISAYDSRTGKVLWQTRAPTSAQGFPMSYAVRGRQYVAVPVGTGIAISALRALTPEIQAPRPGNGLLVFALPESAGAALDTR